MIALGKQTKQGHGTGDVIQQMRGKMEGGLPRKRFRMVVNDGDFPGSSARHHATKMVVPKLDHDKPLRP